MSTTRPRVRPLADLLRLFVAPSLWFAQFIIVYGAETLVCTQPVIRPSLMILIGAAATAAALMALFAFAVMLRRRADQTGHTGAAFLHDAALWLALLSGLAVIWTAFPLAVFPGCAPPAG